MRKFVTLALAGLFLSPAALAATTDSIALSGEVASTVGVVCADTVSATALDLGGAAGQIVMVSECTSDTNNDTGLTITLSSGDLANGGTADTIPYQVSSVAAGGAAPLAGDFTAASGIDYTTASTVSGSYIRDAYILFDGAPANDPATYTATINVTVADNT